MDLGLPKYNLEHSRPIIGYGNFTTSMSHSMDCMVDTSIVDKKFALWDYVIRNDLLNSSDKIVQAKSQSLLHDKTIWLYHFAKLNGKPVKTRWSQDIVLSDDHDRVLFCACNQHLGKEQPYSAKILTSSGYVTMGSLNIGDKVLGSNGFYCEVRDIFEQGKKAVYRLTFDDGTFAECGLDHLWKIIKPTHKKINSKKSYKSFSVMSLKEIISQWGMVPDEWNRISIPFTSPINFKWRHLSLHPYLVGVILGDGSLAPISNGRAGSCGRRITTHPDDVEIIDRIREFLPPNLLIEKDSFNHFGWTITAGKKHTWKYLFKNSGLQESKTKDKEIPRQYLYTSINQRIELLRGLMDTDGSIYGGRTIEFTTKSKKLAEQVAFLVRSLGGKAKKKTKQTHYIKDGKRVECGIAYRVYIGLQDINPFYLKRKAELFRPLKVRYMKTLRKIEYVRDEISRCILVDSPDNTYLTNDCIVTHNSTTLDFDASTEFLKNHGKRWVCILVSNSLSQSQERMSNIKQLLNSMDIKYKSQDIDIDEKGVSNATQLSIYMLDEHGKPVYTNLLICCPHTSSALGYPADYVLLDEVDFWEDVKGGQIHFFNQVLDPRTYFTQGKIKGYSNPNGKERLMWFLWNQKDEFGKPFWHRYHFNYWDKGGANQLQFNKSCIGKTKNEIESTLLAAFTTQEGSFFSTEEIKDMYDVELAQKGDMAGYGRETAWFLDVGSVHDQSVLIGGYIEENPVLPEIPLLYPFYIHKYPVGYPIGRVVGTEQPEADDGWCDYYNDNLPVKEVLSDYALDYQGKKEQPLFGFDATGNAGMLPLFQVAGIDAVDITFSGKKKWHMYQRFQYYVQQRFIHRGKERDSNTVRGCDFDYQASKLTIRKQKDTQTNYKQIHHENENDLDDCMDSLAGWIHLIENPDLPSLSFDIINTEGKSVSDAVVTEQQELTKQLEGQYVPSWVNKNELHSWMEQRQLR